VTHVWEEIAQMIRLTELFPQDGELKRRDCVVPDEALVEYRDVVRWGRTVCQVALLEKVIIVEESANHLDDLGIAGSCRHRDARRADAERGAGNR
jgi:hypothetical protein